MDYRKRTLLGFVAMACACSWGAEVAFGQAGAVGQPTQREERPDQRTPATKEAENYDAIGVPLGSFRLFPVLELDEVYNDNIYAAANSVGKTGSFIQLIKPSLDLRS